MGTPACRISDTTAHGGVVSVGFPQVLIGNLPASRIGDLHTCPMVTGVVPHVGGPFILGSPTVLVGMMPQSRVTDELTCVGPPDVALTGEFTVLVGMAGAGGAAGAMDGVSAMGIPVPVAPAPPTVDATAQMQRDGTTRTSAPASEALPPVELKQEGWPNLPPENTATFQSVQPAKVMPGSALYAAADADSTGESSYWSTDPPAESASASGSAPGSPDGSTSDADWNAGTRVLVYTVPAGSEVRAWAGQGAETDKLQVWTPPGAIPASAVQRFRASGRSR